MCALLMRARLAEGAPPSNQTFLIVLFPAPQKSTVFSLVAEEGCPRGVGTFVVLVDIQEAQKLEGLCCCRLHCSTGHSVCAVMLSIAFG